MNMEKIRLQSRLLFYKNKKQITYAFYMITCLSMCFQALNSGWLILLVQIILVTLPHGCVYISLQLVQNGNLNDLSFHDILIGLIDLLKYFPSYLTRMLMIYLSSFAILMPGFLISSPGSELGSYELMSEIVHFIVQRGMNVNYTTNLFLNVKPICYIFVIGAVIVYMLLSLIFIFVPYIVEDYDYSWLEALKRSIELIQGHFAECIQLLISFIPNMIIYNFINALIMIPLSLLGFYGYLIYLIVMIVLQIRLYLAEYHISIAMLYLEIRDEKKDEYELFKIK